MHIELVKMRKRENCFASRILEVLGLAESVHGSTLCTLSINLHGPWREEALNARCDHSNRAGSQAKEFRV